MLEAKQLRTLRVEAAQALDAVQSLRGFSEELQKITVPGEARGITLPDVRRVCSDTRKKGEREEGAGEEREPTKDEDAGERTQGHGPEEKRFAHRLRPGAGPDELLSDVDGDVLSALEEYLWQVEAFARDYVFGAEWAARAVHEALRSGEAIRLPDHPPAAIYRINRCASTPAVWMVPGDLVEGDQRDALLGLYQNAIDTLEASEPVAADSDALALARAKVRSQARRSAKAEEIMRKLDEDAAPGHGAPTELGRDRSTTWHDAIRRVDARLRGSAATPSERTAYTSVKVWLNAAVNGSWKAEVPLEGTDAADYFSTVLPRLEEVIRQSSDRSRPPRTQKE